MNNIRSYHIRNMFNECGLFTKYPILQEHQSEVASFMFQMIKSKSSYRNKAYIFIQKMCVEGTPAEKTDFIVHLIKSCGYLLGDIPFLTYINCNLKESKIVHFLEDFCGKKIEEILKCFASLNMVSYSHMYFQSKFEAYLKYHGVIIRKILDMHLIMFLAQMMSYIKLAIETNTVQYLNRIYICGIRNTKRSEKIIFQSFYNFMIDGSSAYTIYQKSDIVSYLKDNFVDAPNVINLVQKIYSKLELLYRFFMSQDMEQINTCVQKDPDMNLIIGRHLLNKKFSTKKFITFKNLLLTNLIDESEITSMIHLKSSTMPTLDQLVLEI